MNDKHEDIEGKRRFRRLKVEGIENIVSKGISMVRIQPEVLTRIAKEAFYELSYFLRPDYLDELAGIAGDETADINERFVCSSLLKNAIISSEGLLPLCQDTGTATLFAWRGGNVFTGADDRALLSNGIMDNWAENPLRNSQIAATDMFSEANTGTNLPAQIDIEYVPGDEYRFLFIAKGGGSSNKTMLYQGSKALLNDSSLFEFLEEKINCLGVAACPPYTIGVVVGGTSPENNLKTLKLATACWYDDLPVMGTGDGEPFRDRAWEKKVMEIASATGWGAQFGGRHMALQARVIRLSRHAGSCPVSIGVSCSAHRNMLGKINKDGAFLEVLDHNPARLSEKCLSHGIAEASVNLDQPMAGILSDLSKFEAGDLVFLNGTLVVARDMAHAAIYDRIQKGGSMPDYFINHPVYYAGPAKTPPDYVIGSFGPTTAQRMDQYVDCFMENQGSMVMLAKGNRSADVVEACAKHGGFYLGAIGGAAALIAKEHVIVSEIVDFPEFGMEAVYRIVVKRLPAFIIYDNKGRSLYGTSG